MLATVQKKGSRIGGSGYCKTTRLQNVLTGGTDSQLESDECRVQHGW